MSRALNGVVLPVCLAPLSFAAAPGSTRGEPDFEHAWAMRPLTRGSCTHAQLLMAPGHSPRCSRLFGQAAHQEAPAGRAQTRKLVLFGWALRPNVPAPGSRQECSKNPRPCHSPETQTSSVGSGSVQWENLCGPNCTHPGLLSGCGSACAGSPACAAPLLH